MPQRGSEKCAERTWNFQQHRVKNNGVGSTELADPLLKNVGVGDVPMVSFTIRQIYCWGESCRYPGDRKLI